MEGILTAKKYIPAVPVAPQLNPHLSTTAAPTVGPKNALKEMRRRWLILLFLLTTRHHSDLLFAL